MTRRTDQIGFSQRVRLEWLDRTANLILAGNDKGAINGVLQEFLKDKVSIGGQAERGNREKIITILMKTWLTVPSELEVLRDEGLSLLKRLSRSDHLAIHWGMVTAVYPFWSEVAQQVGRLLRLQGTATAAHVQRRVREQCGERETVSRATRRILTSFRDWGVLSEGKSKGIYVKANTLNITHPALIPWLFQASLCSRRVSTADLNDLLENPALFPFHIDKAVASKALGASHGVEIIQHGLNERMVVLRSSKQR